MFNDNFTFKMEIEKFEELNKFDAINKRTIRILKKSLQSGKLFEESLRLAS